MDERSVRGFQKSAKADVLFRVLLVKQHSKIGICFAPAIDEEIYLRATSFEVATCHRLTTMTRVKIHWRSNSSSHNCNVSLRA